MVYDCLVISDTRTHSTGGTRTPWGYEAPFFFWDTRPKNFNPGIHVPKFKKCDVDCCVVSAVTFSRGKALKDRLFKLFCNEVGNQHNVLFHTEMRRLTRGRVLLFVFELCKEIEQFLRHQDSGIAGHFENKEFVMPLTDLAGIFSHLNDVKTSIQGTAMNMIRTRESIVYARAATRNGQTGQLPPRNFCKHDTIHVLHIPPNKTPSPPKLKYETL